ncbi:MAG: hypothetical protein P4K98_08005, partial [Bryobacteraceae bacterium]|nr:hypothetical protein [Bryobacteraceae bacterium]
MTGLLKCTWAVFVALSGLPVSAQIGEPARPNPASIMVFVTDLSGHPIPEAEVAWANAAAVPRRMRSARPLPEVLQTDLNGKCSIELPSEGTYRVAVRSE